MIYPIDNLTGNSCTINSNLYSVVASSENGPTQHLMEVLIYH